MLLTEPNKLKLFIWKRSGAIKINAKHVKIRWRVLIESILYIKDFVENKNQTNTTNNTNNTNDIYIKNNCIIINKQLFPIEDVD